MDLWVESKKMVLSEAVLETLGRSLHGRDPSQDGFDSVPYARSLTIENDNWEQGSRLRRSKRLKF